MFAISHLPLTTPTTNCVGLQNALDQHHCWTKRPACLMKQISLLEITSAAAVLLAVVVESSRVFHFVG